MVSDYLSSANFYSPAIGKGMSFTEVRIPRNSFKMFIVAIRNKRKKEQKLIIEKNYFLNIFAYSLNGNL